MKTNWITGLVYETIQSKNWNGRKNGMNLNILEYSKYFPYLFKLDLIL